MTKIPTVLFIFFSPDDQSSINWQKQKREKKSHKFWRTLSLQIHREFGREENFPVFLRTVTIDNIFQKRSVSLLCHLLRSAKILYFRIKCTTLFRGFKLQSTPRVVIRPKWLRRAEFHWKNLTTKIFSPVTPTEIWNENVANVTNETNQRSVHSTKISAR